MSNSKNTNFSSYSIEEFQKYIDSRIKKGIQNSSNLILTGTVEKSYPGGYDIKIENSGTNSIVLATSLTKDNYIKGDFILLIKSSIINSGASIDRYFILGKVGITVKDVQTLLENQIDFRIVGDTKREVFKQDGYDFKEQNQLIFLINNKDALFKDIFLLGYIQLSALFTTEQKCNYGFFIEYCNENDIVLASQKIDTNSFVGNIYFQENYPQSGIVAIPKDIITAIKSEKKEERIEIIKISLFADREEGIEIKTLFANNIAVAAGNYEKIYDKNIKVIISADKNGKDYFRGVNEEETIEDAITLVATTFFDTQELLTEDIDFYWEVKQDNKWELLNENQTDFSANIGSDKINNFVKYKTKNISTLKINEQDDRYKYFQNYLTKVRCRIQYKTIESISEEFDVINHEKGNYSLSFLLKSGTSILTSTTDRVEIEAKIINNNSFIQDEELNIDWQWKIFVIEENGTIGTQNLGSGLTYDTITIKNDGRTSIASREIEIPDGAVGIQCAVAAQLKDSNGEIYLTLESDPEMSIIVRTDVSNNTEVRASTIYKYCLSSNMSLVFEEDSNSEVGWRPVDWTKYIEWKNLETRDKEGITALNNMSIGANKYLYYTQATIWEKYNKHEFLSVEKTDPWTRPQLLRYVNLAGENITGAAIEQINTFNQLTNNGKEQGIFYDESQEDGKKLYINATFIQSGTLRVGDNTDERFYASLNDSVVRIGGWGVGANELISKNQLVGLSSDAEGSNVVIWAGGEKDEAPFRVLADGTIEATKFVQIIALQDEIEIINGQIVEINDFNREIDDSVKNITKEITGLETGINWFTYKDTDNDGNEDTIIINAGKHLYLGSGSGLETGEGQLTIMTEPLKLFKLKNEEYGLVIDTANIKINEYNENGEFVETGASIANWTIESERLYSSSVGLYAETIFKRNTFRNAFSSLPDSSSIKISAGTPSYNNENNVYNYTASNTVILQLMEFSDSDYVILRPTNTFSLAMPFKSEESNFFADFDIEINEAKIYWKGITDIFDEDEFDEITVFPSGYQPAFGMLFIAGLEAGEAYLDKIMKIKTRSFNLPYEMDIGDTFPVRMEFSINIKIKNSFDNYLFSPIAISNNGELFSKTIVSQDGALILTSSSFENYGIDGYRLEFTNQGLNWYADFGDLGKFVDITNDSAPSLAYGNYNCLHAIFKEDIMKLLSPLNDNNDSLIHFDQKMPMIELFSEGMYRHVGDHNYGDSNVPIFIKAHGKWYFDDYIKFFSTLSFDGNFEQGYIDKGFDKEGIVIHNGDYESYGTEGIYLLYNKLQRVTDDGYIKKADLIDFENLNLIGDWKINDIALTQVQIKSLEISATDLGLNTSGYLDQKDFIIIIGKNAIYYRKSFSDSENYIQLKNFGHGLSTLLGASAQALMGDTVTAGIDGDNPAATGSVPISTRINNSQMLSIKINNTLTRITGPFAYFSMDQLIYAKAGMNIIIFGQY